MAELLEIPLTAFNSETGRQAGLKAVAIRQQNAKEVEVLRAILADKPIIPPEPVNEEATRQINIANELITHARERINSDECYCSECERSGITDKDKAALIREIRGLMEHICRLKNIAQAPTSKASNKPQQARPRTVEPQSVVVEPQEQKPGTGQDKVTL